MSGIMRYLSVLNVLNGLKVKVKFPVNFSFGILFASIAILLE